MRPKKPGVPAGYVTITNASKSSSIWTALGKWQVYTAVAKKAAPTPTPADNPSDGRPRLKRPGESSGGSSSSPSSNPSSSPASSPTPDGSSTPSGGGSSGGSSDDRPRLHRPDESQSPQPTPTTAHSCRATTTHPTTANLPQSRSQRILTGLCCAGGVRPRQPQRPRQHPDSIGQRQSHSSSNRYRARLHT